MVPIEGEGGTQAWSLCSACGPQPPRCSSTNPAAGPTAWLLPAWGPNAAPFFPGPLGLMQGPQ